MTEDKFNKLCEDVAVIKSKLESFPDHEKRIRSLENFKAKFIGAIILGNVLTGIIVALIVGLITRGSL